MYNMHPYGTRPVRKQTPRKWVVSTKGDKFDPKLVTRSVGGSCAKTA